MNSWLGVILVLLIMLIVYFLIGRAFCAFLDPINADKRNELVCCVYGFLLCQALFSLIEVPMAYYAKPLSLVVIVWGIVLIFLILFSLIYIKKKHLYVINDKVQQTEDARNASKWRFVIVGIVLVQIIFQVLNGVYGSYMDSSTYNGWITTALHTNTILQYDPYTGMLGRTAKRRFLASYEIHSAVICAITRMHPLVFVNQVMAILEIILYNIIGFEIFKKLFSSKTKNIAIALGFLFIFNLSTSYMTASPAGFLLFRTAESKSLLANIIIPMIFLEIIIRYFNEPRGKWWIYLLVILFAGCAIGNSGIFVPPAMVVCGLVPVLWLKDKSLKRLYYLPLILIPNICYFILYFLWRLL